MTTNPSPLTTLARLPQRGSHDPTVIDQILDAGRIAHVGFLRDNRPAVIPTLYVRRGREVLFHGSPASALLRAAKAGTELCLTVTIVDGLVLARSAFHHSANYRSVVVYGVARSVTGEEKRLALDDFMDRHVPERRQHLRAMTRKEVAGTLVIALPLDEASAKIRTGPPVDDEDDYLSEVWAGVIPVTTLFGAPVPDPSTPQPAPPPHVTALRW